MLMIRFQRIGRTNDPAFRIVVLEKARAAKTGRVTEQLGTYNPRTKAVTLDEAKVKEWIANGAQPSPTMHNFLITKGVIEGKKINVLPRKTPIKAEVAPEAPAAPKAAAEPVAEAAPEVVVAEAPVETPVEAPVA
jgi:small subunit ribosomal protein S16